MQSVHQQDGHLQQPETAKLIQVVMQIRKGKAQALFSRLLYNQTFQLTTTIGPVYRNVFNHKLSLCFNLLKLY